MRCYPSSAWYMGQLVSKKISGWEPMKSRMAEMNQGSVVMLLIGIVEIIGVVGIWLPAT